MAEKQDGILGDNQEEKGSTCDKGWGGSLRAHLAFMNGHQGGIVPG